MGLVEREVLVSMIRGRWVVLAASCAAGLSVGLFYVGRATVDTVPTHQAGYEQGHDDGYFDGLLVGEAQGRQEGRALQEGQELPASSRHPVQDAFTDGYAAGANDAFAGYDGGWSYATPYVITIEPGRGRVVYRIKDRAPIEAGTNYFLCASGHQLCNEPRN